MVDYRDVAGHKSKLFKSVDERRMVGTVELDGEDIEVHIQYVVCDTCDGRGKHVNPSIDAHGISAEEFAEDPDFAYAYMKGRYDVPCYECKGQRVVPVVSDENPPELVKRVQEHEQQLWDWAREQAAEREAGC